MIGVTGSDTVIGVTGTDTVIGVTGPDTVIGVTGLDTVIEVTGTDTFWVFGDCFQEDPKYVGKGGRGGGVRREAM